MPQVSLYIDEATMGVLRDDAKRDGVSLSRFVGDRLKRLHESSWPDGYWSVFGALDDDTFTVPDDIDPALDGSIPAFD